MQRDPELDVEIHGMGALIEAHDWSATSLGPAETWSEGLRQALTLCHAAQFPFALLWGADLVQLHNDRFRAALGEALHRRCFGQPLARGWKEAWPLLAPAVERIVENGAASVELESSPFASSDDDGSETDQPSIASVSLAPLRGSDGEVAGIMVVGRELASGETLDRRRGVLTALDERLSGLDTPEAVAVHSAEFLGPALELASLGLIEVDAQDKPSGWPGWPRSALRPDLGQLSDAALEALRAGRPCVMGAARKPVLFQPLLHEGRLAAVLVAEGGKGDREAIGILASALDRIHAALGRLRAYERERSSARTLKAVIGSVPPLLWRSKPRGHWFWASPRWEDATGLSAEESAGQGWLSAFHPDDHMVLRAAWTEAEEGESLHATARLRLAEDHSYRWFQVEAVSVGRGDGEQWFGSCSDVDELWNRCEAHKSALASMHHHERALLGLVRAITRRSAEETATADELGLRIEARLEALSRIQGVLSREPQGQVGLDFLIAEELAAHGAYEDGVIKLDGPSIALRQPAAHAVGLAVHELVAHAIRDGALLHDDGAIHVGWRIERHGGRGELLFSWEEQLKEPDGQGHALETQFTVLQKLLASEIGAQLTIETQPLGFSAHVSVPLSAEFLDRTPA